jgi:alanine-glyoxylate transaminase / serine-glyoxylate transaminase / serine-pyruvate transaminase
MVLQHSQRHHGAAWDRRRGCHRCCFPCYNLALGAGLSKVSGKLFRIGHLGDLNDLMVLGALAGAEMAMRDVGIDLTLGSGVAAAQAHFRKTIMTKEKEPTEQERFAQTHPEGVFNP